MKRPRLASPRLLPVVILAAVALLAFKGIGLITNGGYVLTGTQVAQAAEAAAPAGDNGGSSADSAAPGTEPTMTDSSPTLDDTAPTIASKPDAPAKGEGAAPAKGGQAAAPGGEAATAAPGGETKDAAATPDPAAAAAMTAAATAVPVCPPDAVAQPASTAPTPSAPPGTPGINCDAVAKHPDATGTARPLAGANGASPTEQTLLQRLGERRDELDKREADLKMREAIVAAAEKQMQDRADALKALEAQLAQANSDKKSADDTQFASIVKMYETMKPQEAAGIFDGLEMAVLVRVAAAMDPRKMSPILAKMASARAQQLTTQLAGADPAAAAPTVTAAADPNALPQIVGH